jgi:hypothetical protein
VCWLGAPIPGEWRRAVRETNGGGAGGPAHAGLPAGEPTCYLKEIKGPARGGAPAADTLHAPAYFAAISTRAGRRREDPKGSRRALSPAAVACPGSCTRAGRPTAAEVD